MSSRCRDFELLRRYQAGDEEALYALCLLYQPLIWRRAGDSWQPGQDREDLVQEAQIAIYEAAENYDLTSGLPFAAFANRLLKHRMIDLQRQRRTEKERLFQAALAAQDAYLEAGIEPWQQIEARELNPEEALVATEALESVLRFLADELSPLEAEVLRHYLEGASYRDIALALKRDERSVDAALQRLRKKLRRYQGRRED